MIEKSTFAAEWKKKKKLKHTLQQMRIQTAPKYKIFVMYH